MLRRASVGGFSHSPCPSAVSHERPESVRAGRPLRAVGPERGVHPPPPVPTAKPESRGDRQLEETDQTGERLAHRRVSLPSTRRADPDPPHHRRD
jgi:hypothetical protein